MVRTNTATYGKITYDNTNTRCKQTNVRMVSKKSCVEHQETTKNGNDTTRMDNTPARHLHKTGEGQNGVRETDGAKEGVCEPRRDNDRVTKGEGAKEENIKRQIVSTIIKRKRSNNYGKIQKTQMRSQTHHKKHKQRRTVTKEHTL